MSRHQSLPSFTSPRDISRIIRPTPHRSEIPSILNQEAHEHIISGPKNSINYYSTIAEKKLAQKIAHNESPFKSIHLLPDFKDKAQEVEIFNYPQYNNREKQVLKEIKKKEGKLFLLTDIYKEFSKDAELHSKNKDNSYSRQGLRYKLREEEENSRMVEELDKWERIIATKKLSLKKEAISSGVITPNIVDVNSPMSHATHEVLSMMLESNGGYQPDQEAISPIGIKKSLAAIKEDIESLSVIEEANQHTEEPEMVSIGKITNQENQEHYEVEENHAANEEEITSRGGLEMLKKRVYEIKSIDDAGSDVMERIKTKGTTIQYLKDFYRDNNNIIEETLDDYLREAECDVTNKAEVVRQQNENIMDFEEKMQAKAEEIEAMDMKRENILEANLLSPKHGRKKSQLLTEEEKRRVRREFEDKKAKYAAMKEEYASLKMQMNQAIIDLKTIERQAEQLKGRRNEVKELKKIFYKKLLKQGVDSREEGLMWIIKRMSEIGEQVLLIDFPVFLDQRSRKFLVDQSKAVIELKELKILEKVTLDVFKMSREHLFSEDSRFSNLFRDDIKDILTFDSKRTGHSQLDIGGRGSVNSSNDGRGSSLKNAFRLDGPERHDGSEDFSSRKRTSVLPRHMTMEYPNVTEHQIDSPDVRSPSSMNSSGLYQSFKESGSEFSGETAKHLRSTENEEIYNKTKSMINGIVRKDRSKAKEIIRGKRDAESKKELEIANVTKIANTTNSGSSDDRVKVYFGDKHVNDYGGRQGFLMKMQNLSVETKKRQARIKDEYDNEAIRIITEHGTRRIYQEVSLSLYLTAMFGQSEMLRYINKFRIREPEL